MTMQIASSPGNYGQVQPVSSARHHGESHSDFSEILTPEQKNTVQQGADDKIAEQVENVKANYQTAKDIDLMKLYYQQQQKVFDIYMQSSSDNTVTTSSTKTSENSSTVSALTDTYAKLYQLHQEVKEGGSQLPSVDEHSGIETLPASSVTNTNEMVKSTTNQSLTHKQVDAYNSLMMPSTSSYVHLSA